MNAKHVHTVGSSTYDRLKRDIIFGVLAPSTKLKLEALKLSYEASVSTLRETLRRLSSEGFVLAEDQRGFFVAPVSKEDLRETAELRVLLECHALKQSIENGDTEWEGNLVAAHHKLHVMEQRMLSGNDSATETWKRYDWEFHLAMIQACSSQALLKLHSVLYDKYLRYQMLVLANRGQEAVDEHHDMFQAALVRDAKLAATILESHIRNGLDHTLAEMP